MAVQAKFGQYLQDAQDPMSLSQTEKAVEWEQVSSKEQVLPMPVINHTFNKYRLTNFINQIEYSLNFLILALKVTRSGHAWFRIILSNISLEYLDIKL
jgi:hypothetical protein